MATGKAKRKVQIGEKFGKLTLLKKLPVKLKGFNYRYYGLYLCDCGMEKMILIHNVAHGTTSSCGCNYKESNKGKRNARHKIN
jgi:hypothetical protein